MNPKMFNGVFKFSPYIPFDPFSNPLLMGYTTAPVGGGVQQFEYTGWRNEMLSWHDNCYIHAGLNPISEAEIVGPDLVEFLSANLTNGFKKFGVGTIKHGIACGEDGAIVMDGILIRTGEESAECSNIGDYLAYCASVQDFDVKVNDLTGYTYTYQLGGPRSLEIVEAASQTDLHDIGFLQHKHAIIAGHEVRILRVGMAGSLAYEVHGPTEDCLDVYAALLEAGEPFGITKLGYQAYWNTHTENGFPQGGIHFPFAFESAPGYWAHMQKTQSPLVFFAPSICKLTGSVGNDVKTRLLTPYDLNWGGSVSFDHEFPGKAALMEAKERTRKAIVTFEWNTDDVLDIWRSELEDEVPYAPIDGAVDLNPAGIYEYRADKVFADGKMIGISSGRIQSWYYKKMLSLGFIDPAYAEEGRELTMIWGDPGTRQKEIRVRVARYPYFNVDRNEDVDMASIPRRFA